MNNVNISINLPQSDIALMRQLGDRMGWHVNDVSTTDALYDPESGKYLNEETMQAIREVEASKDVMRCNSIEELWGTL